MIAPHLRGVRRECQGNGAFILPQLFQERFGFAVLWNPREGGQDGLPLGPGGEDGLGRQEIFQFPKNFSAAFDRPMTESKSAQRW